MKIVLTVDVPDSGDGEVADEIVTPIVEAAALGIRQHLHVENVWAHIDVEVEGTRVRY